MRNRYLWQELKHIDNFTLQMHVSKISISMYDNILSAFFFWKMKSLLYNLETYRVFSHDFETVYYILLTIGEGPGEWLFLNVRSRSRISKAYLLLHNVHIFVNV